MLEIVLWLLTGVGYIFPSLTYWTFKHKSKTMYHIILYIAGIFHIGFYKTFDIDKCFCSWPSTDCANAYTGYVSISVFLCYQWRAMFWQHTLKVNDCTAEFSFVVKLKNNKFKLVSIDFSSIPRQFPQVGFV